MKNLLYFSLIAPFFFLSSCERIKHGCLDSSATNYTDNANIDNNSCCYRCYDVNTSVFIEEKCGSEVENAILNGITGDEYVQLFVNGNGNLVPPTTPGALPLYSGDGSPEMGFPYYEVQCY